MTQTVEPDQVQAPKPAPAGRRWEPRRWSRRGQLCAGAAVLTVVAAGGGFVAGAGSVDPMESSQYQALKFTSDGAQARMDVLIERNSALMKNAGEVSRKETEVARREAAVKAREDAATKVETAARAAEIPGSGTYVVGEDVKAGTYRSEDNDGCYYAFMTSTDAADIRDNNLGDGLMRVTLRNGDIFESSRCNLWKPA